MINGKHAKVGLTKAERVPSAKLPTRKAVPGTILGQVVQDVPVEKVEEAPLVLMRPEGAEYTAAIDRFIPEVQALVVRAVDARQHPEPLFYAMQIVIGHHIDTIAAPQTGDDLVDRLCMQIRIRVQERRKQIAEERGAADAAAASSP